MSDNLFAPLCMNFDVTYRAQDEQMEYTAWTIDNGHRHFGLHIRFNLPTYLLDCTMLFAQWTMFVYL